MEHSSIILDCFGGFASHKKFVSAFLTNFLDILTYVVFPIKFTCFQCSLCEKIGNFEYDFGSGCQGTA